MSDSGYPENYDFEAEGNATLSGKLISVNAVAGTKYGTDEPEQKFVANIEDENGVTWAVWLNGAVLKRSFTDEARNRKAIGERFRENEAITIEYLGKRKGDQFTYKDFKVTFEYAAPSLDGFDALAGDVQPQTADQQLDDVAIAMPTPAAVEPTTPVAEDDIPF